MPIFKLSTNLPAAKLPAGFLERSVDLVAKTLGKPKSYVVVQVLTDQLMNWGGSDGLCAVASVESIGALGRDVNKKHSKAIADHLQKELGIASDKCYINFVDLNKANCGYSGTTFDDLL
ncbi:macrophage migration inhibitory factor-like [Oppia nitens]|uniref:macrophage migration inhibitory factor-like n=1 Tax=Oppia nitens TaxID=1686743 RepID=UPI0023DAE1CE|nr:macrophage migration inhibitory factor-like [Oppia nitens]